MPTETLTHDQQVQRLADAAVMSPELLAEFTPDEVEVLNVLLDARDKVRATRLI